MNFQQLRSVRETARRGFNLTEVAAMLHTSQPGVSRQIRELEEELGIDIFVRAGKRLTGLTPPGTALLPIVERMLLEADNLRRAGADFRASERGRLSIAATHSQARYALPVVVRDFISKHPDVKLEMHQGSPTQIAEWVLAGEADIGIATEALDQYPQLVTLPVRQWSHCVIAPEGHPITRSQPLALTELAKWPLITYDTAFTGRSRINRAFERLGATPNIALTALDADVIKTYVELGLGVGILASMAFNPTRDPGLRKLDSDHLFDENVTRIAVRRGHYLRGFAYRFIELCAPELTEAAVADAVGGAAS